MHKSNTQGFGKEERLHGKKDIQELFDKGSSFYLYPFRCRFLPDPLADNHRILISVSRRSFKHAATRNLIKRRIREAYRRNKADIALLPKQRIAYIYTAREVLGYSAIEKGMRSTFRKLQERI
ncbi:MAG: ribonuclease P protein component [Cyclobacteriaceae bacterium]